MQAASTTTIEFEFTESLRQAGQDVLIPLHGLESADIIRVRFRNNTLGTIIDRTFSNGLLWLTDGTDGIVRYKFTEAEATAGQWDCQGYVEWTGVSKFNSNIRTFTFRTNLPAA